MYSITKKDKYKFLGKFRKPKPDLGEALEAEKKACRGGTPTNACMYRPE